MICLVILVGGFNLLGVYLVRVLVFFLNWWNLFDFLRGVIRCLFSRLVFLV